MPHKQKVKFGENARQSNSGSWRCTEKGYKYVEQADAAAPGAIRRSSSFHENASALTMQQVPMPSYCWSTLYGSFSLHADSRFQAHVRASPLTQHVFVESLSFLLSLLRAGSPDSLQVTGFFFLETVFNLPDDQTQSHPWYSQFSCYP